MTHLGQQIAALRDSLGLARSALHDARARLDALPHGTIDRIAWGERRQVIEAVIVRLDGEIRDLCDGIVADHDDDTVRASSHGPSV